MEGIPQYYASKDPVREIGRAWRVSDMLSVWTSVARESCYANRLYTEA